MEEEKEGIPESLLGQERNIRRFDGVCVDHGAVGDKYGYAKTRLNNKPTQMHRAVFARAHGLTHSQLVGWEVCHKCDNSRCINVNHLVLGTPSDNTRDKIRRGRMVTCRGLSNGNSKLSDSDVESILKRYVRGNGKKLASEFGVSATQISNIVNNKQRNQ